MCAASHPFDLFGTSLLLDGYERLSCVLCGDLRRLFTKAFLCSLRDSLSASASYPSGGLAYCDLLVQCLAQASIERTEFFRVPRDQVQVYRSGII